MDSLNSMKLLYQITSYVEMIYESVPVMSAVKTLLCLYYSLFFHTNKKLRTIKLTDHCLIILDFLKNYFYLFFIFDEGLQHP